MEKIDMHFTAGRKCLFFFTLLLSYGFSTLAQMTDPITGQVTDEHSQPLSGVTIVVEGTSAGTTTDAEGNYSLAVPEGADSLVFSFIGYDAQRVPINNRNEINVMLKTGSSSLRGIVVIGYGSQSREEVTTSISKLDEKVLDNIPYANAAHALEGTLPGVRVQSTSGQPGAAPRVIVRGGTSIDNPDGANPLYVVDGVIRPNMDNISPDNIESIQVLKDAASAAIYGARGSNGVVLITTKSGQAGKMRVDFSYNLTVSNPGRLYDLANAREYLTLSRKGLIPPEVPGGLDLFGDLENRLGGTSAFGTGNDLTKNTAFTTMYLTPENRYKLKEGWESMPDPVDPSKTLIFKGTDWQKVLFQTGISHDAHVRLSGGSENATFNAGLGYLSNEGTAISTGFKRLTFNLKGNLKVQDNLSFSASVDYARSVNHKLPNLSNAFARYITLPPTVKYRFEDGTLAPGIAYSEANPAYILSRRDDENTSDYLTLTLGSDWKILPGLSFKPQLSLFTIDNAARHFQRSYFNGPGSLNDIRGAGASDSKRRQLQAKAVFSYVKSFARAHNLNLTAGASYFKRHVSYLGASGQGASTDLIPTLNASSEPVDVNSSLSDRIILSYFARANYNFKQKYLLSLSMRYDGASNLGRDNKWGIFPAVSAGWNLDKEDFWKIFPEQLLRLKLRASYGETGNIGELSDFAAQGRYDVGSRYNGEAAIVNSIIPNPGLKWEASKTFDVGADIGIFNARVNITVDYYRRTTQNLITQFRLPPSSGFSGVLTNLGSLENKGLEFSMTTQVLPDASAFQWNISFNAAKVKNKILKLPFNDTKNNRIGGYYVWDRSIGDYAWKGGLQEGGRMGDYYAYKKIGIFPTDAAAQSSKNPVDEIVIDNNKIKFGGDVKWLDNDKNGVIDSKDMVYVGNEFPTWTGGFSSSFSYKHFDLYARFDFSTGFTIFNYARAFMEGKWKTNMNITKYVVEHAWKKQGDVTNMPRYWWYSSTRQANQSGYGPRPSSEYYESGNFLSVRELTLSYTFPKHLINKLHINGLRLNLTGSNLYYFTEYKGLNPEFGGRDYGRYPIPRNFTFGVNISL